MIEKNLSKLGLLTALWICAFALPVFALADEFIPEKVFAGKSEGHGISKVLLGSERPYSVENLGTAQADGSFRLDQRVHAEGKPVEPRFWIMRRTSPDHYSATLSDAAGPVEGHVKGSRLELAYPLKKWGLVMRQTLDLSADGRTIANYGSIRFLGIPIGHISETIRLER